MSAAADVEARVVELCTAARQAARRLAQASTADKNQALRRVAAGLRCGTEALQRANARDLEAAREQTAAFRDRLTLDADRIEAMARGVEEIIALADPIGESIAAWRR